MRVKKVTYNKLTDARVGQGMVRGRLSYLQLTTHPPPTPPLRCTLHPTHCLFLIALLRRNLVISTQKDENLSKRLENGRCREIITWGSRVTAFTRSHSATPPRPDFIPGSSQVYKRYKWIGRETFGVLCFELQEHLKTLTFFLFYFPPFIRFTDGCVKCKGEEKNVVCIFPTHRESIWWFSVWRRRCVWLVALCGSVWLGLLKVIHETPRHSHRKAITDTQHTNQCFSTKK